MQIHLIQVSGKPDVFANAFKHDYRSKNPTTRCNDIIRLKQINRNSAMKNIALITICLLCSIVLQAQDIEGFVHRQLQTYPRSRLLDLYKSCFQDYMGAEHLVSDRQRVKAYLDEELSTTTLDDLMPWNYESCGIEGNYVRVSIRTIKENVISENMLLDAFIRSANTPKRPSVEEWSKRWHVIIGTIDQMQLGLPHYEQDKAFIDSVLTVGRYAISHSPEYREAYYPHYRIVERGIFERELKPLIERKYSLNKNSDMDDKKQIEQLYKQMYKAMIAKDIAALDSILAEGSVLIHMTGTRQPKKQYLHEIENGTLNYYSVEDDEISITVNGTTAEMTGRSRVNAAVYGGGRHTWRLQMKSKLSKTNGRWQFVESKASTY